MYEYRIYKSVYDEIINGTKTIEIRLLNDKSDKIKSGDTIKFNVVDSNLSITVKVLDKYIYDNIDLLWQDKDIVRESTMNYTKEEFTNLTKNIHNMETNKSIWSKILHIAITILTAIATTFGVSSCMGV